MRLMRLHGGIVHHVLKELGQRTAPMRDLVLCVFLHFCVCLPLTLVRLENRIPSEIETAPRLNDFTRCSTFKDMYLVVLIALGKGKKGRSRRGLVIKADEHSIQSIVSTFFQEPLDVWTRHPIQSCKRQTRVFRETRTSYLFGRQTALLKGDLLGVSSLELWQINFFGY